MHSETKPLLLNDCFLHDKDRMRHDEAVALLRTRLTPIAKVETLPLDLAAGRILASDVKAKQPVPGYDNAAVDGYAYSHDDFEEKEGVFSVSARIAAGDINPAALKSGTAVRIFTGAPAPAEADTIAMQEDCTYHEASNQVTIPQGLKRGANLRKAGEDLQAGDQLAGCGDRLRPQDVAALASIGQQDIECYAPLKIALISTGNEIKRPGSQLEIGQVYDSNHYLLRSMMDALPVETFDLGIIADDRSLVEDTIVEASRSYDVVITTGGASRGEEDYVVETLEQHGNCHLWQLAIKPGRPMTFGQIGSTIFFGLPGNPVASFVCFLLYVRPSLLSLGGGKWPELEKYPLPVAFDIPKKKPDRREFWRGSVRTDGEGNRLLHKFERDGSGLVSGLRAADGLIEVPEEITEIELGQSFEFIPFSQFF